MAKIFRLKFRGQDIDLRQGETTVGRSPRCQIVLDDGMVSRRHCRFLVMGDELLLEDLNSVNGAYINEERLEGRKTLKHGDQIRFGREAMDLSVTELASDTMRMQAATLIGTHPGIEEPEKTDDVTTRVTSALNLLTGVADKVLALGRSQEAERLLEKHLEALLDRARSMPSDIEPELAETGASYALKIADGLKKGAWVSYTFNLYGALKRPMPAAIIDTIYAMWRTVPNISASSLRAYLDALRSVQGQLGPADKFLVRRIEGLESLAGLR